MGLLDERNEGLLEAINGGHLHWSDFRENVLRSFNIRCTGPPTAEQFPTTFLARLQAAQKNINKHDAQRESWRMDVSAGRGLTSLAVFPPNLLPPQLDSNRTMRCMMPRMSREGLPLRISDRQSTLYELPTAKPIHVFGFDMQLFSKAEQAQLQGALQVTGISVNFSQGEISPDKSLCCPFLAFERVPVDSQLYLEAARNSCAIIGAQCLRGQQQLFHKAFGLQTVSQPPITFTCALNNEQAVINHHFIGTDGEYNMAAVCKFDLQNDDHYNTFQAWIEAIESWASMYLLPRIQGAVTSVVQSHPSPPPSPSPSSSTSHLSINTMSSNVLTIVNELRRVCPTVPWGKNTFGETPINSSMAQCGTPLPTREMRSLALPRPPSSPFLRPLHDDNDDERSSLASPRMSKLLSPLQTNIPPSRSRSRSSAYHRLLFSPTVSSLSQSDGSTTPVSPCRPPSLSPCTPGPDMPMTNMNPMLVLRRRLDVAVTEIEELRLQVDDLQGQLNDRTVALEEKLEALSARSAVEDDRKLTCVERLVRNLEDMVEPDLKTPTANATFSSQESDDKDSDVYDVTNQNLPGTFEWSDENENLNLWTFPTFDREFLIWCLARVLKDTVTQICLLSLVTLMMNMTGSLDTWNLIANMSFVALAITKDDNEVGSICYKWYDMIYSIYEAAGELQLEPESEPSLKMGASFDTEADIELGLETRHAGDLCGLHQSEKRDSGLLVQLSLDMSRNQIQGQDQDSNTPLSASAGFTEEICIGHIMAEDVLIVLE